jgi:UDP-N-acetylmuramoyl-L-alanyl-D-glutamate--2,6-diaminopimelate ligase
MIQYDSRQVKPGDTFVAIPGLKHDGADFIPQALANGATTIVAESNFAVPAGIKFEKVPSARKALAYLADKYYNHPSQKLKLIGVTGTKGKTTVAFLLQSILKVAGFKAGMIGTITSKMTTPESVELQAQLAQLVADRYTHCVIEVSSHALAQERVANCKFAAAVFTNLAHDHLDFHQTMADYLAAKQKLFTMLDQTAVAIINVDDPASNLIISVVKGEVFPYGIKQAVHELRSTKYNEFDTTVTGIVIKEDEMSLMINTTNIRTPLIGMHNVYNIAAAYQCALALGILPQFIKKGIEAVKVIPGRQEEIKVGQDFRVIVDFAHTPDSLQKLLETYRPFTKGKLILVFGCPGERDKAKRPLMGEIAIRLADQVFVTTDDPHGEDPMAIIKEIESGKQNTDFVPKDVSPREHGKQVQVIVDRKEAITSALASAKKGDIVLLAGRGHEKYQDFKGTKIPLDDKEVVKEFLQARKN